MSEFFFIYTISLLIVCVATSSVCGASLLVSHSRRFIPRAGLFVAYFTELSLIFGTEWLDQNVVSIDASNYYAVDMPLARIMLGALIMGCMWATVLDMLDERRASYVLVPAIALMVAQAVILAAFPYGPLRQWLFYTMRQICMGSCLAHAFLRYHSGSSDILRQRMYARRHLLLVLSTLTLLILIEDTCVILIASIPDPHGTLMGLFLSSRNFCENLMMLYLAWYVCRESIRTLSLRYQAPSGGVSTDNDLREHINNRLPSYASVHGLSSRECEVLTLALEGKSNREISNELILAEGTIKTHLHNIMQKCGKANREDLARDFWSS